MWIALVLISIVVVAAGFLSLTQATQGVGIVAVGAVLAIFARLAQASKQHAELRLEMKALRDMMAAQRNTGE